MQIKYYPYLFGLIYVFDPLIFGSLIDANFKKISVLLLIIYLLKKVLVNKIHINTIPLIITFFLFIVITLGVAINYDNQKSFISLAGFLCTITLAVLFFIYSKKNKGEVNFLITQYRIFFEITSICTIISIIFVYLFGNIDIYGLSWDGYSTEGYVYISTPFGLILPKFFGELELLRGMFFFVEPAYLGFFLGFNLIFIYVKSNHFSNRFLYLNFIAGILTLSLTFIQIFIFIFVLNFLKNRKLNLIYIIKYQILTIMLFLFLHKIFEFSSFIDRLGMLDLFLEHFLNSSYQNILFGNGITKNEFNMNLIFSSGMLQAIYEFGVIGFILIILLFCNFTNYNFFMLGIFLIGLVTFDVHKTMLFWYSAILIGICINSSNTGESSFISYSKN